MASTAWELHVNGRGKGIPLLPKTLSLLPSDSTAKLHERLASASRSSIHRLRVSRRRDGGDVINSSPSVTLQVAGLGDQSPIFVKDLGPQISWRTVYLIEYIGALIAHPAIYALRLHHPSPVQTLLMSLMLLHFIKRELETIFVHRFSNATMPFRNIFKNSFHYWILSGLLLAWSFYSPMDTTSLSSRVYVGLAVFFIGELANLHTHLILRGLRSAGGTERGIPRGISFQWVTCPNYMYEIIAWVGVFIIYPCWATCLFIFVAVLQMRAWAYKKEMRYRREFGDTYKPKKYSMLPGIC